MFYAVAVDDDSFAITHLSEHATEAEALNALIEFTKVEQAWRDDLAACCDERGVPMVDQEEEYVTIKAILDKRANWTLDNLQDWTRGSDNQNTMYIYEKK